MKIITTSGAEETLTLGEALGKKLAGRETIALYGEPGAGKTVLTKGIARGLGIEELVTSPTFTILNVYEGRAVLYHYDMYRIGDISELDEVGFFENLGAGVTVVEWAENVEGALPADVLRIRVGYDGASDKRRFAFDEDPEL